MDSATGVITTVAGNGTQGFGGDKGLATNAQLNDPTYVLADAGGNLIIADQQNQRIRLVNATTGIITTIAGDGRGYFTGDGGKATSTGLDQPTTVFLDKTGNLFIADSGNLRIRKLALIRKVTTLALTTSGSPTFVGQPITFTAQVTSAFGKIPDGEVVAFYDGSILLAAVALVGQTAVYTTTTLPAKTHFIQAVYSGDVIFSRSAAHIWQLVNKYATTTSLASSPNPSVHNQNVTFTAKVLPSGPFAPTGRVRFLDGTTGIGTGIVTAGITKLTRSGLAIGSHSITAEYLGDADSASSTSSALTQVVK